MKATAIQMKPTCSRAASVQEIDRIFLIDAQPAGFYKIETVYDMIQQESALICAYVYPYPKLIPCINASGEKYVRTAADDSPDDALLKLPCI